MSFLLLQGPPPPPPVQSQSSSGDLSLNLRPGSKTTSAPSSPAKSRESLLQRVQSLTGQAKEQVSWICTLLRWMAENNP